MKLKIKDKHSICTELHDLVSWENLITGNYKRDDSLRANNIVQALRNEECSKLFIAATVNLNRVGLIKRFIYSYLKEGLAVHLQCEYPDLWHFIDLPGDFLSNPKEFVKRYGEWLSTILNILVRVARIGSFAASVAAPGSNFKNQMKTATDFLANLKFKLDEFIQEESFKFHNITEAEGLDYLQSNNDGLRRKELPMFLNKADENGRFGD